MARQYAPKTFLRQAPNGLLKEYLTRQDIGAEINWNELSESDVDPIFEVITSAPGAIQNTCESDFRKILDMADEGGVRTMIEEGKHPNRRIDLAPIFERMSGPLECAFWVFLSHPDLFTVAERFDYADGLRFNTRGSIPDPIEPITHESAKPNLEAALSEYYIKQGRGRGCHVDYYRRGDRRYCFCFLEDYAETRPEYDDEHHFKMEKHRPAFEVIFIYDPIEHTLESRVKGGREVRADVEMRFGQAILGVDLGELGESEVVHKLDALLDRDFQFPTRPDDRIEQVAVRQLRLSVKGRRQWITLDVGSDSPQGAIYDLLDDVLSEPNFSPSAVRVDRARLKVTFRPDESGKPRNRTFTISHPDSHTLKNDPNDEIIKSCLKRWKLDVSGSDESGAPKPGEPAQYRLWR